MLRHTPLLERSAGLGKVALVPGWNAKPTTCGRAASNVIVPRAAATSTDPPHIQSLVTAAPSAEQGVAGTGAPSPPSGVKQAPELPPLAERPGVLDDRSFQAHPSVNYWRNFKWPPEGASLDNLDGARTVASAVARNAAQANLLSDTTSALFWAYHVARCAYFAVQGAASIVLHEASNGSLGRGEVTFTSTTARLTSLALSLPAESMGAFHQDLANIKAGEYKLPWDMTTLGHRQYNPIFLAQQSMRYQREALKILARRRSPEGKVGDIPYSESNLYPDYYQNNFHFQSDGWFSSDSAKVYDEQTETLFVGRQDAMQRSALVPMRKYFPGTDGSGMRMLEVGAGTGRFATYVRDNFPAADLTVSDLSPFYLEQARKNMQYWERMRRWGSRSGVGSASFTQCAAESLPFEDNSMDVVYSVYMFHELPQEARDAAISEMARVLRPGGLLVIADSNQLGDRPANDEAMGNFSNFNEPHYLGYIRYDFGDAMRSQGLSPYVKVMQSSTKAVSAVKRDL